MTLRRRLFLLACARRGKIVGVKINGYEVAAWMPRTWWAWVTTRLPIRAPVTATTALLDHPLSVLLTEGRMFHMERLDASSIPQPAARGGDRSDLPRPPLSLRTPRRR